MEGEEFRGDPSEPLKMDNSISNIKKLEDK